MKVSATRGVQAFRPIEVKIVIENQDEYDAAFALGNWSSRIRNSLQEVSEVNPEIVNAMLHGVYEQLDVLGETQKQ